MTSTSSPQSVLPPQTGQDTGSQTVPPPQLTLVKTANSPQTVVPSQVTQVATSLPSSYCKPTQASSNTSSSGSQPSAAIDQVIKNTMNHFPGAAIPYTHPLAAQIMAAQQAGLNQLAAGKTQALNSQATKSVSTQSSASTTQVSQPGQVVQVTATQVPPSQVPAPATTSTPGSEVSQAQSPQKQSPQPSPTSSPGDNSPVASIIKSQSPVKALDTNSPIMTTVHLSPSVGHVESRDQRDSQSKVYAPVTWPPVGIGTALGKDNSSKSKKSSSANKSGPILVSASAPSSIVSSGSSTVSSSSSSGSNISPSSTAHVNSQRAILSSIASPSKPTITTSPHSSGEQSKQGTPGAREEKSALSIPKPIPTSPTVLPAAPSQHTAQGPPSAVPQGLPAGYHEHMAMMMSRYNMAAANR